MWEAGCWAGVSRGQIWFPGLKQTEPVIYPGALVQPAGSCWEGLGGQCLPGTGCCEGHGTFFSPSFPQPPGSGFLGHGVCLLRVPLKASWPQSGAFCRLGSPPEPGGPRPTPLCLSLGASPSGGGAGRPCCSLLKAGLLRP